MNWRDEFPLLQNASSRNLIYFDNAATTQKPQSVIQSMVDYYQHSNANIHRAVHRLGGEATALYEAARNTVANFIGAPSSKQVVFTKGATEALNLVAHGISSVLKEGETIVVSGMEHHANWLPWQHLAQQKKLNFKVLPVQADGSVLGPQWELQLTRDVKLLAITHASNVLGCVNDLARIIEIAHDRGIIVVVDGTQATGHFPIDVAALNCDFYAFSGHKMYGPTGIGVLYAASNWLERLEAYQLGGDMVLQVSPDNAPVFNDPPYKFEAGTPPIAGAIGLAAAIQFLKKVGWDTIVTQEQNLRSMLLNSLKTLKNIRLLNSAQTGLPIMTFQWGNIHPHDLATFLDQAGVAVRAGHHCAMPLLRMLGLMSTTRISLAFYNTPAEIEHCMEALLSAQKFFKA